MDFLFKLAGLVALGALSVAVVVAWKQLSGHHDERRRSTTLRTPD